MLDGNPALKKGHSPQFSAHLLWPNGWMDQDATWYGDRPRPWHIVLDEDPAPLQKGAQPPQFSVRVCCGQTAGWTKMPLATGC